MTTSRININFVSLSAVGLFLVAGIATAQVLSPRHPLAPSPRATGAILSVTPFGSLEAEALSDQRIFTTSANGLATITRVPVAPARAGVTDFILQSGNFLMADSHRITGRFSHNQQQLMFQNDGTSPED